MARDSERLDIEHIGSLWKQGQQLGMALEME